VVEVGVWSEDFEGFNLFMAGVVEDKGMDLLCIFDVDGVFVSGFVDGLLCVHVRVLTIKVVWYFLRISLIIIMNIRPLDIRH
jgi:hypothetical protein